MSEKSNKHQRRDRFLEAIAGYLADDPFMRWVVAL